MIEAVEISASSNEEDNKIIKDILNNENFLTMYRKQVEQMSANGTVGAYVRIDGADIYKDGSFKKGKIKIQYCDSLNIIPLTVINDEIIEVAFTGSIIEKSKLVYVLVMFTLKDGLYQSETTYFDEYGKELPNLRQIVKLSDVKPFAIMRTAEVNNLKMNGYGYPKLWSAIPSLKTIDLTITMWNRDLYKSDKLILINDALCTTDDEGKPIPPSKEMKKYFVQVGSAKLPEENSLYQEYNPKVRIDEVQKSLELALSILSMSFGFGTKKYTFENGRIVTASEYVGEKQDSMQEINKQRSESIKYITDLVKSIAYFYEQAYGKKLNIDEVKVDFDDSYIEDRVAIAESMRNDAMTFEIPKLKLWYFMKKYNLTKSEAKKLLNEIPSNDEGDEDEE